ncbi:MAG: DUF4389 domain-containing protein [Pseudomonadales bacterium]|jgi:hypothetical protein|nr:DUF4389 domain-containing protein [Pseudomonadales bacterium]
MSLNQDQLKRNLLSHNAWLRVLLMAGFAVAVWVTLILLSVVMLVQTILVLITGTPNVNLQRLGLTCGAYLFEAIQFLLYNTEDKPFPFAPFPDPSSAASPRAQQAKTPNDPPQ